MSRSPAYTRALAARLGEYLRPGDVVALTGELGAGKTEFVRGLARGLGVPEEEVASPSFSPGVKAGGTASGETGGASQRLSSVHCRSRV